MSRPTDSTGQADPGSRRSPPPFRLIRGTASIDDLDEFLARLDQIADETGAVVQAFDAKLVVSAAHLSEAIRLAARSIARGEAVARDPAVEILLYAAGRRQIDRAFELGVSEGEQDTVVIAADFGAVPGAGRRAADLDAAAQALAETLHSVDGEPLSPDGAVVDDDTAFDYDEDRVREFYRIADRELAATAGDLAAIVRERVALLDVEK